MFLGGDAVHVDFVDVVVRDNRPLEWSDRGGSGVHVAYGARVSALRALFEQNHEAAIIAFNAGTEVSLVDVEVRHTLELPCAVDTCEGMGFGSGVVSLGGAHVELERFSVADNALSGVQLAYGTTFDGEPYDEGGTIDLHEGVISGNLFGANVQTEGFDITQLMDRVIWRDNFRNIDSTEMPLPDLSLPSGF